MKSSGNAKRARFRAKARAKSRVSRSVKQPAYAPHRYDRLFNGHHPVKIADQVVVLRSRNQGIPAGDPLNHWQITGFDLNQWSDLDIGALPAGTHDITGLRNHHEAEDGGFSEINPCLAASAAASVSGTWGAKRCTNHCSPMTQSPGAKV